MARKNKSYIYTNKKHSEKGMFATALALIVSVALIYMLYYTYGNNCDAPLSFGTGSLLCTIFSGIGVTLGIMGLYDANKFRVFVYISLVWNALNLFAISGILYAGI